MPFEVGEAINTIADKFISAPVIGAIAQNPIYTALVITFIITLIIMFIFRDADTDESLLSMSLRGGFYIFILLTGAILLNNRILMGESKMAGRGSEVAGIFNHTGAYSGIEINGKPLNTVEDSIIPIPVNYDSSRAVM